MRTCIAFAMLILFSVPANSQELFIQNQPASSVPKGVLGVRAFVDTYKADATQRNLDAVRVMYGLTSKLSISLTASESNHHGKNLPKNLITHTHIGNQTVFYTQSISRGIPYPYRFNGFYFYAQYRFLSIDGQNSHFRMSAYGEYSNVNDAHDEAEPNLLDDTKGVGAGLIITCLKNRFSASLTTGVIISGSYEETVPVGNGSILFTDTKINYGRAVKYNLSFGYLLFPKEYQDYNQNNWNIYLEFMGKSFQAATVIQDGIPVAVQTPLLKAGNYVEVYPGIQKIINSNLRIDFSVGFPLINGSYTRFYPVYMIGVQRYFFQNKKSKKIKDIKNKNN